MKVQVRIQTKSKTTNGYTKIKYRMVSIEYIHTKNRPDQTLATEILLKKQDKSNGF